MGLLDGKVAVVSGAARGQGRAHEVRLAREGADIIAMDICADIDTIHYPLARPEDLDETVAQIEQLGRRVAATQTDVRDATAVAAAIGGGVAKLGGLDIVVANAGIAMYDAADTMSVQSWRDMIDTNLTGVWSVCRGPVVPRGSDGPVVSVAVRMYGSHTSRGSTLAEVRLTTGTSPNLAGRSSPTPRWRSLGSPQQERARERASFTRRRRTRELVEPWMAPISNVLRMVNSDLREAPVRAALSHARQL